VSKDLSAKQEKLSKLIKDAQTNSDETIAAMSEAIRNEMEQMKKKIQGELKNEIAKMQQGERET
jgi:F0F1-type ATP synthase membrane subunit b/b'